MTVDCHRVSVCVSTWVFFFLVKPVTKLSRIQVFQLFTSSPSIVPLSLSKVKKIRDISPLGNVWKWKFWTPPLLVNSSGLEPNSEWLLVFCPPEAPVCPQLSPPELFANSSYLWHPSALLFQPRQNSEPLDTCDCTLNNKLQFICQLYGWKYVVHLYHAHSKEISFEEGQVFSHSAFL